VTKPKRTIGIQIGAVSFADEGVEPHKRLLKKLSFSLAFGFRQTAGNLRPLGECVGSSSCGEESGAEFT
jgi:hypothetical protein